MELTGKRVVIVGGGSGIGRAVAVAASLAGAAVVIGGRGQEALDGTANLCGGTVESHEVDASVETEVEGFFEKIGAFDHLVSTIGQSVSGPICGLKVSDIERAMAGKIWAPIFLVKHGSPRIAKDGSFTFFSGIRGARPTSRSSITSMVNRGLEAFAMAMAIELGPVRVNVISPGIVDSGPFWDQLGAENRDRLFADFAVRSPAGRVGRPEDQAGAVLFAMGNRFLTGAVLSVDGGALLM